ncbi:MAG TPA: EF-hand domain-containing protein [Steroidobacteraceae bacterium]|nr:EF-hand domain-containing protein [Steroidobacteraceae bacterium]
MRRHSLRLGALLLVCATAVSACMPLATRNRPDAAEAFQAADANHDGTVTRAELIASRAGRFSKLDRNGDGYIDSDDLPKRLRRRQKASDRIAALIAQFDKDGDGRISRDEFVNGPTLAFDRADTNHDGKLSPDELKGAKAALRGRAT